ncbi:transglutaminase-like cysteine peptidase [Bradyrhizobium guangzhouense]|uniref:transglutaminase-like cysteine peptidase n=1 Tax=Bradyrhizobium guangzhouense TaxID=1325095 RepID=UPI001009F8A5|nr:transglutaminase-like cysteine peptidase [Bradyrhizobium guangzhouense]RXH10123.1 hypothetical protein EAS54_32255 [Bradyrhizobium guangzhouense]
MRRRTMFVFVAALVAFVGVHRDAQAGLLGMPLGLRGALEKIRFEEPAIAPMAFTMFCVRYSEECQPPRHRIIFRGGSTRITKERMLELIKVNAEVNRSIAPSPNQRGLAGEEWVISPTRGDCNDYAVTKRHELLARGWPMRNLLLSEVVTSWGEHHLVLVVRARGGDLVLDNLNAQIRPWSKPNYRWVRIQTPQNPSYWASVAQIGA